jgi:hypothetical protein
VAGRPRRRGRQGAPDGGDGRRRCEPETPGQRWCRGWAWTGRRLRVGLSGCSQIPGRMHPKHGRSLRPGDRPRGGTPQPRHPETPGGTAARLRRTTAAGRRGRSGGERAEEARGGVAERGKTTPVGAPRTAQVGRPFPRVSGRFGQSPMTLALNKGAIRMRSGAARS